VERHRILVIGAGSIGERHVRCAGRTGRAEISICEVNDALRGRIAERYAVREAYASLDAARIESEPPQAAVVCTPAHLHVPMALQLAEQGVHLLIEKPLSTSPEGVDRLRDVVERKRLTAGVAYVLRLHPALSAMRDAVCSGRFGKPVQLAAVSGQHFPHYRPAYREIYYRDRATGGGAIQDALTHLINAGEWLVGPVTQLAADAAHQVLEGVEVEDTVHVIARHGRVPASYSLNQHQAPNETVITVVCERGTVRCELHLNRWLWMTEPEQPWHEESLGSLQRDELFVRQAAMFLDAVIMGKPPVCSLEEGAQTLRVNLAVIEAAETRSWQVIAGCQ